MSDEIEAAANELIEHCDYCERQGFTLAESLKLARSVATWARARLAAERAEREERERPIDEGWLRSTLGDSWVVREERPHVCVWKTRAFASGFGLGISIGDVMHVLDLLATRGQLIDLLAALGVERKGGA